MRDMNINEIKEEEENYHNIIQNSYKHVHNSPMKTNI